MRKLLTTLAFILLSTSIFASHIAGEEIRYEFNGVNYTVYLSLYKICDPFSVDLPPSDVVNFKSTSLGINMNRTFAIKQRDTVDVFCSPATSSCYSTSSIYPGFTTGIYIDTVTLPPASDWVISYMSCCRGAGVLNIQNASGAGTYVEAKLNNSAAINSSPTVSAIPGIYINASQPPFYYPLKSTDAEGDSVAYELVTPMINATTTIVYASGYTLSQPLGTGSICQLTANNSIALQGNTTGVFTIALLIKEYRNNALIASYMREMSLVVLNGGTGQATLPLPSPSSVFNIYTCPGQNNNITVSFVDSIATDSVFVVAQPPVIAGWSFSTSSAPAAGTGSATISWTTPSSVNPATFPSFKIKLNVRDNACPKAAGNYYITVRLQPCSSDSVWPGDANGDKTVNIYDPLAIAIASGKTGPARTSPTTTWTAQACAPWSSNFYTNNLNMKHADCNGDGTVNSTDLGAVTANYGQWHLKGGSPQNKITGIPDLYFDLAGVVLLPGANASIPIKLGNSSVVMTNMYGVATRIKITGLNLAATPAVSSTTSWLGTSSNTLNFTHPVSAGVVDWAHSRTNQQETGGQGTIGTLSFAVPATAKQGDVVNLAFELTKIIDKNGLEISAYNIINTTIKVGWPISVGELPANLQYASVVPNPSGNHAALHFGVAEENSMKIQVLDMVGKTVWHYNGHVDKGSHVIELPSDIAAGLYTIQLLGDNDNRNVIKWVKE